MEKYKYEYDKHIFELVIDSRYSKYYGDYLIKLIVNDIELISSVHLFKDEFMHDIGFKMITNVKFENYSESDKNNVFIITPDKVFFRENVDDNWIVMKDDDFSDFHDWLLTCINPELYSNRLRKIKLHKINKKSI